MRRALGPERSLGAACGLSRHAAIEAGEAEVDYVSFAGTEAGLLEIIGWWAEVMTPPVVAEGVSTPDAAAALADAGADFVAPELAMPRDARDLAPLLAFADRARRRNSRRGMSPTPPLVSFEFFPPKTEAMAAQLWATIAALEPLAPRFVSVTYGAGGSTRELTHDGDGASARETRARRRRAPHLRRPRAAPRSMPCSRDYWAAGIRHIVALRGDPPGGDGAYRPASRGLSPTPPIWSPASARIDDFEISVAAYPETHPAAPTPEADLDNLKRKLDAGATRAITQFFFDTDGLSALPRARRQGRHRRADRARHPAGHQFRAGGEVQRACAAPRCRAGSPSCSTVSTSDPDTRKLVAAMVATEQCRALAGRGRQRVPLLHAQPLRPHARHLPPARPQARRHGRPRSPGLATDTPPPQRDPNAPD